MAINGNNKKRASTGNTTQNSNSPFRVSAQPPPFRATGKGFFNKLPHYPAGPSNANASLVNKATGIHDLRKIYLFVDAVETGWTLSGETTQTQHSRSFYPRNLTQDELTIEGVVASQFEYDKLVEFVLHHHQSQFTNSILNAVTLDGDGGYPGVDFTLFKPKNSRINTFNPMKYMVVITDVQAGAQQFKMAGIPFQLTCTVIYDYLQKQVNIEKEIDSKITFEQVFGSATNPAPTTGSFPDQDSITYGASTQ